jgi:hypothetical protein
VTGAYWDNFQLQSLDAPVATPAANVGAVKALGAGHQVQLQSAIITSRYDSQGFFYVEDESRANGIKVKGSTTLAVGTKVSVLGTTGSEFDEMFITAATGGVAALAGGSVLDPVVVHGRALDSADGLSPIGLFVKVAGKVVSVNTTSHVIGIDDGGSVYSAWYGTGFTVPAVGDVVICRGSAGRQAGPASVIWMQDPSDLRKVAP